MKIDWDSRFGVEDLGSRYVVRLFKPLCQTLLREDRSAENWICC